jgi:ParB family chromosome partitioning protein
MEVLMVNKALGKGLSALIPPKEIESGREEKIIQIPTSQIKASKYQPRVEFNEARLKDLVSSIKEKGVVQPVLVRRSPDGYELIAGERRLRAVKALGIERMPAIVRDVGDADLLELSLIENIQREELNPMEEARAFQRFITDFKFTQERIAQVLGKDRSTITNTIRLLSLPKKIQDHLSKEMISAGHARAILSLPTEDEQLRVCNLVVKKGLSVRETEILVLRRSAGRRKAGKGTDAAILDLEARLQAALGTRVRIFHGKKRGRIQIEYYSADDLNRLLGLIAPKI